MGPRTIVTRVVLCGHILGGVFSRGSLSVRAVTAAEARVTKTSALVYKILTFIQPPQGESMKSILRSLYPDCALETNANGET